jgi:hypothetical protein
MPYYYVAVFTMWRECGMPGVDKWHDSVDKEVFLGRADRR